MDNFLLGISVLYKLSEKDISSIEERYLKRKTIPKKETIVPAIITKVNRNIKIGNILNMTRNNLSGNSFQFTLQDKRCNVNLYVILEDNMIYRAENRIENDVNRNYWLYFNPRPEEWCFNPLIMNSISNFNY